MKDSCGLCSPFNYSPAELEPEEHTSPRSPKTPKSPGNRKEEAAILERNKAASPTLESIPEGEKEKSRSYDDDDVVVGAGERQDADSRVQAVRSPRGEARDEPQQEPPMKEIQVEMERDFDKDPTDLYKALQEKDWQAALEIIEAQPDETKTWISRKEPNGQLRWRLLPIHAAVVFAAPDSVFEALLKVHPGGAAARDDQGMLPLHLSYRMGCSESVVALLVDTYPESIEATDRKGRTPLVLAQTSKGPNRAAFLRVIQRSNKKKELGGADKKPEDELQAKLNMEKEVEAKLLELTTIKDAQIEALKKESEEKQAAMAEEMDALKKAYAKNQETSQVLVDHITTLETKVKKAELKAAKKIAVEDAPPITDDVLRKENGHLKEECKNLRFDNDLLKQQLEKRSKSESLFAAQVAAMGQQIQNMTEDNGASTNEFASRIKEMEEERKSLRFSIHILSKKLYKVSEDLGEMSREQQRMIRELKHHENQARESAEMHATVMEQLMSQDAWMETIMEERKAVQIELERQTTELKSKHVVRQNMMRTLKDHSDHLAKSSLERFQYLEATTAEDQKMRDVSDNATCELPDKDTVAGDDDDTLVDQVVGAILTVHEEQVASFESEHAGEDMAKVEEATKDEPKVDTAVKITVSPTDEATPRAPIDATPSDEKVTEGGDEAELAVKPEEKPADPPVAERTPSFEEVQKKMALWDDTQEEKKETES